MIKRIAFSRYMTVMVVRRYCLSLYRKCLINAPGSNVAKFAGLNVHKRLVTEEAYKNDDYEEALKKAFLGTDEDLLASQFLFLLLSFLTECICRP